MSILRTTNPELIMYCMRLAINLKFCCLQSFSNHMKICSISYKLLPVLGIYNFTHLLLLMDYVTIVHNIKAILRGIIDFLALFYCYI